MSPSPASPLPSPPHCHDHWRYLRHWPPNCQSVGFLWSPCHFCCPQYHCCQGSHLAVASQATSRHPPLTCEVMELDCLSFDSVRKLAETWEARKLPLNLLINNAGIFCMTKPQNFSKDGCEQHMQVNHLAPALLTVLLLPSLARGAPSRVVMVNSIMHNLGYVDPKDLNMKDHGRTFHSISAYSTSKLAQVMFSNLLQRRLLKGAGIDVVCVHPGEVITQVARNLPKIIQIAYAKLFFLFTSEEGARGVLFCATDKQVQDHARRLRGLGYPLAPYFGPDLRIWPVGKQALDMETAHLLWEETLKLVDLPADCIETALTGSIQT